MAIKLIAVDMDGTFLSDTKDYDRKCFAKLYEKMLAAGIEFVVASGNQYYQLASFHPDIFEDISYVADNGAYILATNMPIAVGEFPAGVVEKMITLIHSIPNTHFIVCGQKSAYAFADVDEDFYETIGHYYHRLEKVTSLAEIDDKLFKFALHCPLSEYDALLALFRTTYADTVEAVSSGHGDIDLLIPGLNKANGLRQLGEHFGISPDQMLVFGDGDNDSHMLKYAKYGFVMENATAEIKALSPLHAPKNTENGVLVILSEYFDNPSAFLEKYDAILAE
ncbi:flavin mononucleotide phosphatase [Erysipelotrichaceae bacterium]|nr:flavin mononucleotide phosphatase [Erysipelotrichaceae bacterium]